MTALLESAATNFKKAADQLDLQEEPGLVMLLCDDAGSDVFPGLRERARAGTIDAGWTLEIRGEEDAVIARKVGRRDMHICAGRQIRTTDGLEVLAVCTDQELPDGRCLSETLGLVRATHGIPVIPWGFGKWLGRRGRIVSELFNDHSGALLLAGDNGGRPKGFPEPRHLKRVRQVGMPILAGSDPLPFPGEEKQAASYGSHTFGVFDADNACASVRKILHDQDCQLDTFGHLEQPLRFIRNQVGMQIQKYRENNGAEN